MRDQRFVAITQGLRLWRAALVLATILIAPGAAHAAICNPTTAAELVTAIDDTNAGNCPNNTITLAPGATYTFVTPNSTGESFLAMRRYPR